MIDVRRLRILREVALSGSISGAARAIGYTPSAVSQQLAVLERECGTAVLQRRGRGVELTAEGRLLVDLADRVGSELEAAEAELARRAAHPSGQVRLLAFATALRTFVPGASAALGTSQPGLALAIDEADPDDALRLLMQQQADVVVGHDYDLLERRSHARVHRRELLEDELLVVGTGGSRPVVDERSPATPSPAAPTANGSPIDLACLADRPWVFPDRGSACDRVVERACAAAGFAPRIVARSSDFTAIAALAHACDAVALVPDLALDHRTLPAPARPLTTPVRRRIFAAVREGAQRRPLESAVLDALSAAASAPSVSGPVVP